MHEDELQLELQLAMITLRPSVGYLITQWCARMDGVARRSDPGDGSGHWHGCTAASTGVVIAAEAGAQVSRGVCYLGRQLERVRVQPMVSRPVGVTRGCQQHLAPLTTRTWE